ncbi:MAG: hypothetical protein K6A70_09950 [Erysipelotrichaceae bacterium]|nr:hypothetical protein [Erysipelotrichaceae bacterium]
MPHVHIYQYYRYEPGWDGIEIECIRVKSGSGIQEDPFVMDVIHPYRVNLQASAGGTITVSSSDTQRQPETGASVKWESGGDFTLTAVANPDNNYSFSGWYEATVDEQGNITGYTGDPLFTDETITLSKDSVKTALYALFTKNSTISEVPITIDPPIAGTSVTYEGQDVLSQKPVPALSVSGNCSVSTTDSGRSSAIWVNKNNILEALTGDFVAGESYMFVAGITPDQGYAFAEKKRHDRYGQRKSNHELYSG